MRSNSKLAAPAPNNLRFIREAIRDGVNKCKPSQALVRLRGVPQSEEESDVRDGKRNGEPYLDEIVQRLSHTDVPFDGPNGIAQIFDRAKFAAMRIYGAIPSVMDLKAARKQAQAFDSRVDLLEHDLDDMNEAELEDFAAWSEACERAHGVMALAARVRALQKAESRRGARRQLAGVA